MLELLAKVTKEYNEVKERKVELKIALEGLEIEKYLEWKEENPKARTAMDKVIGELKASDEAWQNMEISYEKICLKVSKYGLVIDIVKKLIGNEDYPKDEIKKFIEEAI